MLPWYHHHAHWEAGETQGHHEALVAPDEVHGHGADDLEDAERDQTFLPADLVWNGPGQEESKHPGRLI